MFVLAVELETDRFILLAIKAFFSTLILSSKNARAESSVEIYRSWLLNVLTNTFLILVSLIELIVQWTQLSSYDFDIFYRSGSKNQEADALSRSPIDFDELKIV